jgi:hypothetical protein
MRSVCWWRWGGFPQNTSALLGVIFFKAGREGRKGLGQVDTKEKVLADKVTNSSPSSLCKGKLSILPDEVYKVLTYILFSMLDLGFQVVELGIKVYWYDKASNSYNVPLINCL